MITNKQLVEERDGLVSLRGLVGVYEEIAASKMQKVRGAVIQTRYFLDGLMRVYSKAKQAYRAQVDVNLRRRNGLTVVVFVSANSGLYGDIVERIFEEFVMFVEKNKCQVVILGKLGVKMMEERLPGYLYNYYDISDDGVDLESFEMVMGYLLQFEKINVFYGQFKSILNQEPIMVSVTGDATNLQKQEAMIEKKQFLFEPTAADIARLFEGEILASIFEQTLHESALAKFASRMLSLDRAADNVEKRLNQLLWTQRRIEHTDINRKQINIYAGHNLWGI